MRRTFSKTAELVVSGSVATLLGLSVAGSAMAAPGQAGTATRNMTAARSVAATSPETCVAGTDARRAADAYLDSLLSHDASGVPFAPDVLRIENSLVTGRSADEIRNDLNTSGKYRIITGLRNRAYTESGPATDGTLTVNVDYRLDIGVHDTALLTVRVRERFDVRCGLITYINANIGLW